MEVIIVDLADDPPQQLLGGENAPTIVNLGSDGGGGPPATA